MDLDIVADGVVEDAAPLNRHYEVRTLSGWEDVLFLLEEVLAEIEVTGD